VKSLTELLAYFRPKPFVKEPMTAVSLTRDLKLKIYFRFGRT
jgi:hypothetical protein